MKRKADIFFHQWTFEDLGEILNTIQYNLFPPEVIPTVWLHTFAVSDD